MLNEQLSGDCYLSAPADTIERGYMIRNIIIIVSSLFVVMACASVASNYTKVKKTNIITAYQQFIHKYPETSEAKDAQKRIDQLIKKQQEEALAEEDRLYDQAKQAGTINALERFIIDHRENRHWDDANLELAALKKRKKDTKRFSKYQQDYPVDSGMEQNNTALTGAISGYSEFLKKYPDNVHREKAQKIVVKLKRFQRENQEFEPYNLKNTIDGYENFLSKYPKSRFVPVAIQQRDDLLYQDIRKVDTIKAYEKFLSNHPKNSNNPLIIKRRDFLVERKKRIKRLKTVLLDREIDMLKGHTARVNALAIHNNILISGGYDSAVKVWKLNTGELIHSLLGHQDRVLSVATDGQIIASGSYDKTVRIWDIKTGKLLKTYIDYSAPISSLIIRDGVVYFGSHDGSIQTLHNKLKTIRAHNDSISSILVNDKLIISGSRDGSVKVWNKKNGQLVKTLSDHQDSVTSLVMNSKILASGSYDNTIKLWDIENDFKQIGTLSGHDNAVMALAMDEEKLYSGSHDKTVRIWNLSKMSEEKLIRVHSRAVYSMAVQGGYVVSGSQDHRINVINNKFYQAPFDSIQNIAHGFIVDYLNVDEPIPPEIPKPTLSQQKELVKDEFETIAQFQQRKENFKEKNEQKIHQLEKDYAQKVMNRNQFIQQINERRKERMGNLELMTVKYTRKALFTVLGIPMLRNALYDAEKKKMYADLNFSRSDYSKRIEISIPVEIASAFKQNLDTLVEPKVTFRIRDKSISLDKIVIHFKGVEFDGILIEKDYTPEPLKSF